MNAHDTNERRTDWLLRMLLNTLAALGVVAAVAAFWLMLVLSGLNGGK